VKLLDKMMHGLPHQPGQQVVLLSQVLAAEVNIGYEDMLNTQVGVNVLSLVRVSVSRSEGIAGGEVGNVREGLSNGGMATLSHQGCILGYLPSTACTACTKHK
jgi:hypothetical protein